MRTALILSWIAIAILAGIVLFDKNEAPDAAKVKELQSQVDDLQDEIDRLDHNDQCLKEAMDEIARSVWGRCR